MSAGGRHERLERVASEQRVDRHRVDSEARDRAEWTRRLAEEGLRVGLRGDVDIASLGVGDHQQAVVARHRDGLGQDAPARGSEPLKASDLELDRDALLSRRLDRERAMRSDRAGGSGGGGGFRPP